MEFKRGLIIGILGIILIFVLISNASAYTYKCLTYGESVPDKQDPRYTCHSSTCQICVNNNNYPTHPGFCNEFEPCEGGSANQDLEPPLLVINSPINDEIYSNRRVNFELSTNEPSSYYYLDNIDGRNRWKRLSSKATYYSKGISLNEGFNDITIRAVDIFGNDVNFIKKFYIDSKEPRISNIETDMKGWMKIKFTEDNPVTLILHYGNILTGYSQFPINIEQFCVDKSRGRYECEGSIPLDQFIQMLIPYNSQEIESWFELTDISGSKDISKKEIIFVDVIPDTTKPILTVNSPIQDEVYNNRKVYFNLSSNELVNFYYLDHIYGRDRIKKLDKDETVFQKSINLKDGLNDITFIAIDKAGNEATVRKTFYVDSKKPNLGKIEIDFRGGYYIEFKEYNPKLLVMKFGNEEKGYSTVPFDIQGMCEEGRNGKFECETQVSLLQFLALITPYKDSMIEYWFELTDIAGETDTSKKQKFYVDITPPVILNPESVFSIDGRKIEFYLEIDEENFDSITYIDNSDSKPREKRLCTRLKEGKCMKKTSFRTGSHELTIFVFDEAGNMVTQDIGFVV
ncbi:hypothetical protein GOV12_00995 [Candidatus Pacearchaeota archaeon]|nr:hypothetical protein [Candidatus Pacearchaeota archaeon]